jgi:indole-3-glycerol phosphate synthase
MDQPPLIDPDLLDKLEITGFLKEILTHTRQRVAERQKVVPISGLRALCSIQKRPLDLPSVLKHDLGLSLVVEIKRQSPDGTVFIKGRYDPVELARQFVEVGVQALSVATDHRYYQGEVHHLTLVKEVVNVPVLRRDFVFDEYQIFEARAAGADGVYLVASLLGENRLRNLISLTQRLRMTAIVQIQDEEELRRALISDPRVIGINNVDVRTFEVDLMRTVRLRDLIPSHIVTISMGGIRTPEDVELMASTGIDAIQMGETLLTSTDILSAIRHLFSQVESDPTDPWKTIE